MYSNLPKYYKNSKTVKTLGSINKEKLYDLNNFILTSLDNLFIEHSQELGRYETIFGLPINPTIAITERIARIKAKLQGTGTTSIDVIKNICLGFTDGRVEVVENNENYEFIVTFLSGSINDSKELIKQIDEIKPAHLNYQLIASIANFIRVYSTKKAFKQEFYCCNEVETSVEQFTTKEVIIDVS
ncbi:putative phage tail protein [Clostridium sp.]|uniref:putative phage tail protein n=1 Tax=Clostridium sp. TaxID=1506 RepID=UPI00399109A8